MERDIHYRDMRYHHSMAQPRMDTYGWHFGRGRDDDPSPHF